MNKQIVAKELLTIAKELVAAPNNDSALEKKAVDTLKKATKMLLDAHDMCKSVSDIVNKMQGDWHDSKKIKEALAFYKETAKDVGDWAK